MRGIAIEGGSKFSVNGWYLADITGIEEVSAPGMLGTVIKLTIEGSKSEFGESFWLTDSKDAPQVDKLNELFVATNKPIIEVGATAETIMAVVQTTIGTKIAVLMLPKPNKKSGKMFHKLSYVPGIPTLLPASDAGKIYDGPVDTTAKSPQVKPADEAPANGLPF